jgi:hypothetical protein
MLKCAGVFFFVLFGLRQKKNKDNKMGFRTT